MMARNQKLFFILLLSFTLFNGTKPIYSYSNQPDFIYRSAAPRQQHFVVTRNNLLGIYLLSAENNNIIQIDKFGSGQTINWSPDGKQLAFKRFVQTAAGEVLQVPAIYDRIRKQVIDLHAPANHVGVPSFSQDGTIGFPVEKQWLRLNQKRQLAAKYDLDNVVNLAPISPDGQMVVFNDQQDQLWLLWLESTAKRRLTSEQNGYFAPRWSPDSRHLVASTLSGELVILEIETGTKIEIGPGDFPHWSPDGQWLLYRAIKRNSRLAIDEADLAAIRVDGRQQQFLTQTPSILETDILLSHQSQTLFYSIDEDSLIYQAEINWQPAGPRLEKTSASPRPEQSEFDVNQTIDLWGESFTLPPPGVFFDAPYLHQVYDMPDWFDGHHACGATSAMMGLAYYEVLPPWPCQCSRLFPHTSDFGRYVCEVYTFNDFTYNIGGLDASNRMAYGGYGFIIQRNWADTRGYMAQYIRQHGLGSAVDWSPTFAKAMNDINHEYPFVLLNSLTSSGHYILVVGYDPDRHILIVNDPYGDKNYGYKNYNGKGAAYDWPGYHNGFANLNIVHCFIYMRQAADVVVTHFDIPDTASIGETILLTAQIKNQGMVPADSFSCGFYWRERTIPNPNAPAQIEIQVPQLNVGDSLEMTAEFTLPDSTVSGYHALAFQADDHDLLIEMNENNNERIIPIIVRGYPLLKAWHPAPDYRTKETQPKIAARFVDDVVGIDSSSLRLVLDGQDLTASSTINPPLIEYLPEAPLAYGEHLVAAQVANQAGYQSKINWRFTILAPTALANPLAENGVKAPQLLPNYPNPFNNQTVIQYQLAEMGQVSVKIFDTLGRLVQTLVDQAQPAGIYQITWNGSSETQPQLASGIYLVQLKTSGRVQYRSLVLLK